MAISSANPPQIPAPLFIPKWHLKLTVWMGCNVLFVFVPFLADILIQSSNSLTESNNVLAKVLIFFATWYTRKEVLIISTAIAADAFGSLLLLGENGTIKAGLMIGCFLLGGASCLLYGTLHLETIKLAITNDKGENPQRLEKLVNTLKIMSPDIFDIVLQTLSYPLSIISLTSRKIGDTAKIEKR